MQALIPTFGLKLIVKRTIVIVRNTTCVINDNSLATQGLKVKHGQTNS